MGAVKLQAPIFLAACDPREGAEVREADLHRFMLHVEEGKAVNFFMACADLVARFGKHAHPVADEVAFAGRNVVELAGQCRSAPAAHARSEERRVGKECRSRWWTHD